MDLKPGKWKLNFRGGKDKWLVVLAVGDDSSYIGISGRGEKRGGSGGAGESGNRESDSGKSVSRRPVV